MRTWSRAAKAFPARLGWALFFALAGHAVDAAFVSPLPADMNVTFVASHSFSFEIGTPASNEADSVFMRVTLPAPLVAAHAPGVVLSAFFRGTVVPISGSSDNATTELSILAPLASNGSFLAVVETFAPLTAGATTAVASSPLVVAQAKAPQMPYAALFGLSTGAADLRVQINGTLELLVSQSTRCAQSTCASCASVAGCMWCPASDNTEVASPGCWPTWLLNSFADECRMPVTAPNECSADIPNMNRDHGPRTSVVWTATAAAVGVVVLCLIAAMAIYVRRHTQRRRRFVELI